MNRNTLLSIVLGVAALVGIGYYFFLRQPDSAIVTASEPANPAEVTFVNLAAQLEPLGFDTAVLSDPRFTALIDIHTAVVPETTGRRDPFARF